MDIDTPTFYVVCSLSVLFSTKCIAAKMILGQIYCSLLQRSFNGICIRILYNTVDNKFYDKYCTSRLTELHYTIQFHDTTHFHCATKLHNTTELHRTWELHGTRDFHGATEFHGTAELHITIEFHGAKKFQGTAEFHGTVEFHGTTEFRGTTEFHCTTELHKTMHGTTEFDRLQISTVDICEKSGLWGAPFIYPKVEESWKIK